MELKNRHVLITGANRGIGKAFAKVCAESGAHLHLAMREADAQLLEEVHSAGAKSATLWLADLSSREGVQALLNQLQDETIDILFNNAGVWIGGELESQTMDDIYRMMQVNVNALVQLTHGLLPGMLQRKRGKIINNSSIAAFIHLPSATTYAASKAAVVAFTQSLNQELKSTPVSVLLLVTPAVKTQLYSGVEETYKNKMWLPQMAIPANKYALMIREAIIEDLAVLEPSGWGGWGLKLAKFAPQILNFGVQKKYKR